MRRLAMLVLCAAMLGAAAPASSRSVDLDTWLNRELLPYLQQQLTTLPRFRNESFRFVVMTEDSPQAEGTALAIGLRDRIRDVASELPGIRVAWQADHPGVGLAASTGDLDCTKNDADYFIGVQLTETSPGYAEVRVRALDTEERTWVTNFGRSWHGPVNSQQRLQLRQFVSDPTFRGERQSPWHDSETDLMAAHLAYELGCELLRQTAGEYVLDTATLNGDVEPAAALVELVTNNLAGVRALQFSSATGAANSVIEGKAHRIDDDLFQYWVTITPTDTASEMRTLSADAYVRIPDRYKAAALVPDATYKLPRSSFANLSTMSVVKLHDQRSCLGPDELSRTTGTVRQYGFGAADCFAIQVDVQSDAVVFFLNHQLNYGLVRLADDSCTRRSLARVARGDRNLLFPLPLDTLQSGEWSAAAAWSLDPSRDTYFVIASTDTKAARALSRHVEKLPMRCSASVRSGLEGEALRNWLEELEAITAHWPAAIDWRGIQVKDIY